jgi:DNA-binding NtrC family response regulator
MEHLLLFRWPGNIRQLANEMRRVAAFAEIGAVIMPEHLDTDITGGFLARKHETRRRETRDNETIVRLDQPLSAAVEHIERTMIAKAIAQCGGNMERAAALLGLSRKGLYLKRQKYQIGVVEDHPVLEADIGD